VGMPGQYLDEETETLELRLQARLPSREGQRRFVDQAYVASECVVKRQNCVKWLGRDSLLPVASTHPRRAGVRGSGPCQRGDDVDTVQEAPQHAGNRPGGGGRHEREADSGDEVTEGRDPGIVA